MQKIALSDIKNLVEYEKVRDAMRKDVITHKQNRRIAVGDTISILFENRKTVLFQIQEMIRMERIVEEGKIQDEIDAYDALVPGPDQLSATLFIEMPELIRMSQEEVRRAVNRFQGLDREGGVSLRIGDRLTIPARFEEGHSKEEKMAAVHYLRFDVPAEGRAALAADRERVRIVIDHPNYKAESDIPPALRRELVNDLAGR
jgi:Protein of unknown function (DUF3501)